MAFPQQNFEINIYMGDDIDRVMSDLPMSTCHISYLKISE